jgi:dTDP-glucose 4,6-dehydratase
MRLLVTGGCGFIGSNFIRYVLQHYGPEMITNVDTLSTGRLDNLAGVAEQYGDRYEFLHADVADADKIEALLEKHQFFAVVHFAAEPSGVAGVSTLIERARRHGVRRFLFVSREPVDARLQAVESVALQAYRDHREEVVITRATDTYGPYQPTTGVIPGAIACALRDQPVPIAGDGSQVHDWLHVDDHCAALFTALLDGVPGTIHHVAAGHPLREIDLVQRILEHLGKSRDLIEFRTDPEGVNAPATPPSPQAGEARPIMAGARETLAWKPRMPLEQGLRETIDWYVRHREWWEPLPDVSK